MSRIAPVHTGVSGGVFGTFLGLLPWPIAAPLLAAQAAWARRRNAGDHPIFGGDLMVATERRVVVFQQATDSSELELIADWNQAEITMERGLRMGPFSLDIVHAFGEPFRIAVRGGSSSADWRRRFSP